MFKPSRDKVRPREKDYGIGSSSIVSMEITGEALVARLGVDKRVFSVSIRTRRLNEDQSQERIGIFQFTRNFDKPITGPLTVGQHRSPTDPKLISGGLISPDSATSGSCMKSDNINAHRHA